MFSYSVSFSHPTLDREDLEAFLEREFSLWDLTVEQDEGTPPRFRVGFQHPWLEPKTMFAFLERQYGPEDLSVARDGQASLTFTGAREPSDTARPRGPARKTETLMRSIRGLFAGNEVVDWDRIRTVSGSRPQSAVIGVLRRLVEEGEIRRLSQGRYIAKDAPDPDPEVTASPSLGALQTAILAHLETAPAATAESLIQVAKGRAKPTIQLALGGLMEAGKVRRADHGVYVLEGKADPSPDAVAKLRRRKRQKPGSQKPDAEATLLAFLTEPRRIEEVMDHLKMSRPGAARRLAVLEEAGKVARMRVGPRHLYGSDVARLAKEAGRAENLLKPSERRVLEALPPEGRLRLPEIAEAAGVSSGTLLTTARKMSDRGLLDLRQEDGAWHLGLTAEGAQAMRGPEGEETDEAAAYEAAPRRRSA